MMHNPCFDAGHGDPDPGAVGHGIHEDDINLAISTRCYYAARRQGWKPTMTRTADRLVPLGDRAKKANAAGADAFISIHVNSTGNNAHGFEQVVPTTHDTKASWRMADFIQDELAPLTAYKDVGLYSDRRGLAVLRGTNMPATVVEVLSVSVAKEARLLKSSAFLMEVAEQIIQGLCRFYGVAYVALGEKATAKPKPHHKNPTLSLGDHGAHVKKVQRLVGCDNDGKFGPDTKAHVVAFQKKHRLSPDGVVGPDTWAALLAQD